jgi:bifunctional non-homologous end joining protein LigD
MSPAPPPCRRGLWSDSDSGAGGAILDRMLSRPRSRPLSNFIEPCLPRRAEKPPAGRDWIHERAGRAATAAAASGKRPAKSWPFRVRSRTPAASRRAMMRKPSCLISCLIGGEAIVTDRNGLAVFDLIRGHRSSTTAVLCAFDLIELDGEDLRREPIETRKSTRSLCCAASMHRVQRHFLADGAIVYRQACALGCEGIVSKRLGSPYRSGRADCWLKVKNPAAPAVTREAEEEWN